MHHAIAEQWPCSWAWRLPSSIVDQRARFARPAAVYTDEPSESLHGCNEGWHARVSLDPTATALQPAGGGAIAATAAWVARMEQQSGYFGVGIVNGKSEANQGTLWRSAYQLGASFIFTVGARFDHRTDTVPAPPSHSGSSAAPPPPLHLPQPT